MKLLFLLVVAVTLLLGCSATQQQRQPTISPKPASVPALIPTPTPASGFIGGPRISFDKESVDIGKVPLSAPESYAFSFKNIGDQPLEITDARTLALEGC